MQPDQMQQQQLRTWFDAIDTNRSGELDASELQQALRLGNLDYGLTDVVREGACAPARS
jgi:Ca2+-binding EF-hand superfamily protein